MMSNRPSASISATVMRYEGGRVAGGLTDVADEIAGLPVEDALSRPWLRRRTQRRDRASPSRSPQANARRSDAGEHRRARPRAVAVVAEHRRRRRRCMPAHTRSRSPSISTSAAQHRQLQRHASRRPLASVGERAVVLLRQELHSPESGRKHDVVPKVVVPVDYEQSPGCRGCADGNRERSRPLAFRRASDMPRRSDTSAHRFIATGGTVKSRYRQRSASAINRCR